MKDQHAGKDGQQKDIKSRSDPAAAESTSTPAQTSETEQVFATHYAYDPHTYEILCRPGQRLTPKKVKRLQELGLYARLVRLAE